ncbi:hypothetical protein [Helicobacter canis]|uniref:DUF1090 domain-containing protein n=1 Tax=Helicobacter canis NCTC 12740 TaxID=1357399 RepID=V8CHP9_9HELI|nr:hypothetical protein [Helicobacter canis]ETD26889.1 hypothetical protein HMPREF2087_01283 [Helicobacter canis NCTC 12740]
MKCATLLLLGLVSSLYGGAICEYKIKQAQDGLEAYMQKPHKDPHKLQEAQDELNSLLKHCDDREILEEVASYIASMKSALTHANSTLAQAKESGDKSAIHQATLAQKIAQAQYIAARQEELRLKDLLKDNP